jgi:hypothetical protein
MLVSKLKWLRTDVSIQKSSLCCIVPTSSLLYWYSQIRYIVFMPKQFIFAWILVKVKHGVLFSVLFWNCIIYRRFPSYFLWSFNCLMMRHVWLNRWCYIKRIEWLLRHLIASILILKSNLFENSSMFWYNLLFWYG